ncbi:MULTISPECIES: ParB/RepB/Spo0J family partition protein [Ectopseudomonas]|jgi:hypothetical protein|uniref:ParB/RepB/Spo0J family partition protein n=2 Tax=Ectopseudomonas TaxID=3236654 RepID=A0A1G6Q322_9GAMM|nr:MULTISPECIES: ParB N-terminal domain-containing protein [Pseudomonas]ALN21765.1 hypothetical protein DW68_024105 [Pseudomonas mendocina S5.2]KER98177.1 hypothetical protein HN51_25620 [Pseudomonas mendocina]MBP3062062.1 ParB N-terminal domain-containing protein [Pseudomonas chengduensis]NNB75354.1 ParB N-terminal domain-containing protein [Pseudomonas chengduensis]OEO24398.1 hypothetical protein AX279_17165 [Pseudomonas sp. J237]
MSARKIIGGGLGLDSQATVAAQALSQMENKALRRYEAQADLSKVYPSPENPRWVTLKMAGVTRERLEEFKIQPKEAVERWRLRQEAYLKELLDQGKISEHGVWSELFSLSNSVYKNGIDQPITAQPTGEIITGERRWSAAFMAGRTHDQVIFQLVPEDRVHLMRLIENLQRSGLNVAEITLSLRKVLSTCGALKGELGPDNREISVDLMMGVFGCGRTQATYYRALCCLAEDDPLLEQITNNGFTSLRTAYEAASARLRELMNTPPASPAAAPQETGQQSSNINGGAKTPRPPMPQVKLRLPGTEGGTRLLSALSKIEGIPSEVSESLERVRKTWHGAPDRARKKLLATALEQILEALDKIDESEEEEARA